MPGISRGFLLLFVLLQSCFLVSTTTASEFVSLGEITHTETIEGLPVDFNIQPEIRLASSNDGVVISLNFRVDLSNFQEVIPDIFRRILAREQPGSGNWSFPDLAKPLVVNGAIQIIGSVRVEKHILGFRATETADFILSVTPKYSEQSIGADGRVVSFDLGQSLLGDLGFSGVFNDIVTTAISIGFSGNKAEVSIPEKLSSLGMEIIKVSLEANDEGHGELRVETQTILTGAEQAQLILQLANGGI